MRACSAWPCGVWIDGDKRTVPDGSSFAFQHWSHTFEYALVAGPGDWRSAGFSLAGQDYQRDLLPVLTSQHGGRWPARASLVQTGPPGVLLSALKPAGNPVAPAGSPDPADGITVRLRDISGSGGPVRAQVRLPGGIRAAGVADLCERRTGPLWPAAGGVAEADVPASGFVTLAIVPEPHPAAKAPSGTASSGPGRPGPRRRSSPGTGCTARVPRRPGTCQSRCTCPPPPPRWSRRGRPVRTAGPYGSRWPAPRRPRPAPSRCKGPPSWCSNRPGRWPSIFPPAATPAGA